MMRRYGLLIALIALVVVPLPAQQRRFTTIISQPEPLPNCTPGGPGAQMPLVWDITAAAFEFCSGPNSWSILSGGGGGGSGPIIQTNGSSNTVQTTLNFQNVNIFSWSNPSAGNEQLNFSSQSANCFVAAPNGVGGIPSCRLMVAADLPAGTTCSTHFYATGLLAGLVPVCVQPSFTDLLGIIALSQTALTTNGDILSVSAGALARVASAGGQDFVLQGANAAVPVWLAVNNCGSGTQALSYSTSTHTFGCQTITTGTGTINNATQFSAAYYSAAGNTNTISGIAAPTTPSVPFILTSTPSGGLAAAPTWSIPGIPINVQTGTSYTIANTDRENLVTDSNGSATAITLPQAGSAGFTSNFNFALANINTGLVTITPTTSTINGNATQIVPNHWISYIYSDNANYRAGTLPDIAAFPNCVDSAGNHLNFTSATGVISCGTGAPNVPLNQVISPTGAIATLADGNNPLTLNCAQTSTAQSCVTIGETAAATAAFDVDLQLTTLTTSTEIPLQITQGANGPANSNAPAVISITTAAAGGLASASNAGSTGAVINLVTGAGSAGGATTGNGGSGGNFAVSTGVGGVAGGTATNNGGSGGAFSFTTGAGGNGGSGAGTAGNGGNFTVSLGNPGTNSATGTPGTVGQFAVQGTAPASTANAAGVASGTTFVVSGVAGGATSNAAGTGGVGSVATINSGTGGAGTGTNAAGGAGGNINLTAANGGASNGTGANSNGGNIALTVGTAGTGGSGTAGKAGVVSVTGPTAGLVYYTQGSAPTTTNTQIPAASILEYAPATVTPYSIAKPGVGAQGNITGTVVAGAVITQSISGDANHSAVVTIGSGTSIGSTSLCSIANCPAGTYRVNVYLDITTACGTSGTYIVNLIYTDDQGAKTIPVNINGTGAVPATGVLTTTSTANFGENAQIIRSTAATSINYSTTATACGTGGPMVGKLYLSVEVVQ